MMDFKYHVTSMVTIFLALGLGILIGSTMVGGDVLLNQQKVLIDQIEQDFHFLREQNKAVQQELVSAQSNSDLFNSYAYEILPQVIKGRLADKRIAIISGGKGPLPEGLMEVLSLAGAQTAFFVQVKDQDHLQLACEALTRDVLSLHGAVLIGLEDDVHLGIRGNEKVLLEALHQNNSDVIVVGVETSGGSYRDIFAQLDVWATIDNVDSIIGQTALVLAFLGEPGHYGTKESAQQLLPRLTVEYP